MDKHNNWDSYEGLKKGQIVEVPEECLNNFLIKRGAKKGEVTAFNKSQGLALISFPDITYMDKDTNPMIERVAKKWVPIDKLIR